MLEIKLTKSKGRGIFSTTNIKSGTLIEVSDIILLPEKDNKLINKTLLNNYVYQFMETNQECLALGLGSLFNHSKRANVEWQFVFENNRYVIHFYTTKNIKQGQELTINYGYDL